MRAVEALNRGSRRNDTNETGPHYGFTGAVPRLYYFSQTQLIKTKVHLGCVGNRKDGGARINTKNAIGNKVERKITNCKGRKLKEQLRQTER